MSPAAKNQLLTCGRCGSTGADRGRTCPDCRGFGWGMLYRGDFLYWGRRPDVFAIRLGRFQDVVGMIVNGALVVAGLGGFALLVLLVLSVPSDSVLRLSFWHAAHRNLLGFWAGAACLLFFWYRRWRAAEHDESVRVGRYGETAQALPPGADPWAVVGSLPHRRRIDVAHAYSRDALRTVDEACLISHKFEHATIDTPHLFLALLYTARMAVVFGRLGIGFDKMKDRLGLLGAGLGKAKVSTGITDGFRETLLAAYVEAVKSRLPKVEVTDLLLTASRQDRRIQDFLFDIGADLRRVENVVSWIRTQDLLGRRYRRFASAARLKPTGAMNRSMTAVATPYLDQMSRDLTRAAAFGHFGATVGRDREIEATFRAIEGGRRSVVLVGESGVGKQAIIEGIAQRMVEEDVPPELQDKRLVSLNLSQIVSGATASVAQERLLNALYEVARSGNIAVVVPDVVGMVGISAGSGESLDLSEVFAKELERGYFFAITTATPREYASAIEGSPLARRLIKVEVPEPETDAAIRMLEANLGFIEYREKVWFSYDAVEAAVTLSGRYLHEQFLPEKAIVIAREVASAARHRQGNNGTVTREDVAALIAEKTGIPLKSLTEQESKKLLALEDQMHGRVIGQEQAVKSVSSALRRARAELREQSRPIANFLFLGPTGVGKTELAKTLAEIYFGDENAMIRLDMSEYQDKASLYRLVGEPAGAASGGLLSEAVRRKPFSLVLLDEIEKANPDILTVFLQVMDDGRLTDNVGRVIDFTNVILIATSNAGAQFIQDEMRKGTPTPVIKERLVSEQLRQQFRPEFLNRFDEVIVFSPLGQAEIEQITRLMLIKVAKRLEAKGIVFEATDAAVRELAKIGFDPVFGARPLRRAIQDRVDNVIAESLLKGELGRRDRVIYDVGGRLQVVKSHF